MYKVIYYRTESGKVPLKDFLEEQNYKTQTKIFKQILLLSIEGSNLRRPYVDYLKDGIFELRVKFSPSNYRILYFFFQKENIVLTHGFVKKSNRIPDEEIQRSQKYKIEFEERYRKIK